MRHLYIHIPFCKRRCTYCDFAIAVRKSIPDARFVDAVQEEFELRRPTIQCDGLETLYLGGGTPSLLPPDQLGRLIQFFRHELGFAGEEPEITIEANPDDISYASANEWLAAGVNRVSLGVQSLNPRILEWMHRPHTADDGPRAIRTLRSAGMQSVSVDVIFALPPALEGTPIADIQALLEHEPDHISAYGLTVESGTPLARWVRRGTVDKTDEVRYAEEFLQLHTLLTDEGFDHYEISNYARTGRRSRHNQAYWNRRPYLGLGPSAHSFTGGVRRWNIREWAQYDRTLQAGGDPIGGMERLTEGQARLEKLYLGLRTGNGTDIGEAASGSPESFQAAVRCGWLTVSEGKVRATPEGWLRLDALVSALTTSGEGG